MDGKGKETSVEQHDFHSCSLNAYDKLTY